MRYTGTMQGLLLVNKPSEWTSFDVVNYIRRIVANAEGKKPKNVKVGHSGTLDPFATGLLLLLVGKTYTRRASELSKLDKTYDVVLKLGETSTTGDPEGQITTMGQNIPSNVSVQEAAQKFIGQIEQIPPIFSAIKIDGQRAYDLARKGEAVTMKSRPITINSLEIIDYQYPHVRMTADVSSGTYIRTLSEDIGRVLGTGAYTTELKRIRIGSYGLDDAITLDNLTAEDLVDNLNTF
jgi:tRNA pseudouridine55 synthase